MPRRWSPVLWGGAGALLLLLAACGGGGGEQAREEQPSADQRTGGGAQTPSAGGQTGTSDIQRDLQDAAQRWARSEYKITYSASGDLGGGATTRDSAQAGGQQVVLYWKAPNWRMDLIVGGSPVFTMMSAPGGGDAAVMCMHQARSCQNIGSGPTPLPRGDEFFTSQSNNFLTFATNKNLRIERSSRTIAGQQATCASTQEAGSERFELCWNSDGAMLYMATMGYKMEAIEVRRPTDADFQPPYPITGTLGR